MKDEHKHNRNPREQIAIGPQELDELSEDIIRSGALGRSKVYASLLRYLVECASSGSKPKEIEIAIEVLGRNADFDVAKDSAVRVYIHQLRKRLDQYYEEHAPTADRRLVIPKGQYTVAAVENQETAESTTAEAPTTSTDDNEDAASELIQNQVDSAKTRRGPAWPIAIAALLAANLLYFLAGDVLNTAPRDSGVAQHPTWQALLDDDMPILVVMGDYYIFGELDEAGNVARMVRDFDINSRQDLDNRFAENPQLGWQYTDLNLSYLPEGSAFALANIMSVLHNAPKPVNVKMMSELNTRDLLRNHVVYIGYISALDRISNMLFSASGLTVGENYDQLMTKDGQEVYTSNAGLPSFDKPFIDYGWFATFASTEKTQMVVIAGMRDSGLVHAGQAATQLSSLQAIDAGLAASDSAESDAYEALFRVRGLDRMNFDSRLEYASYLSARGIWDDQTLGSQ